MPAYKRIVADIKAQIESGVLACGDQLPSTRRLREQYGVSTQPVKIALVILQTAGYTEGQQGRGVFVVAADPVAEFGATPSCSS